MYNVYTTMPVSTNSTCCMLEPVFDIQWNLQTRHTLGLIVLPLVERLSLSWRKINTWGITSVHCSRPYLRGSLIRCSTVVQTLVKCGVCCSKVWCVHVVCRHSCQGLLVHQLDSLQDLKVQIHCTTSLHLSHNCFLLFICFTYAMVGVIHSQYTS